MSDSVLADSVAGRFVWGAHVGGSAGDVEEYCGNGAKTNSRSGDSRFGSAQGRWNQVRDDVLANDRFTLILFVSFAAIALLLATVGIYGVMTFSVAQRSHEIALRMALGATRSRVVGLVVREGVTLAAVGLGLGLVGAYFIGRGMQSTLYGVSALDFGTFLAVACVLLCAAVLACFVPARKAASTEPMQVLRTCDQPVLRRPAAVPLMVAEMARLSSGSSGWPALVAARLRRMSSTWMRDMGST